MEDRRAGWISLKNKHNLMTKDEVNRKHILRQEGKETNLIEERNRVLFENQKKDVEKEKPKKSNNIFGGLKKANKSDDEEDHSEDDEDD